jgi:hexosaminidase
MKNFLVLLFFLFVVLFTDAQSGLYQIIPQPQTMIPSKGIFEINNETKVIANDVCLPEVMLFVEWLNKATGRKFVVEKSTSMPSSNFIFFSANKTFQEMAVPPTVKLPGDLNTLKVDQNEGAYKIVIDERGMMITAMYSTGIFYASQSLKQMLPAAAESGMLKLPYQLTGVRINDSPKFTHRGLLLDCCRHFMSVEFVKKYIDLLGHYKMNVLHWHLTEDQGWRIQIDKYPLLTEVGAWRTEADGSRYGGFYTKADIREIVAYAQKRHVTIIPEIELPGHSCAAIAAYPELSCTKEKIDVENEWGVFKDIYCAGDENTFVFLENVLSEVCELFPSSYIHIGGDEAPKFRWEQCDKCQKRIADEHLKDEAELQTYFIERIAKFLEGKGKKIIGWDEILEGGIPSNAAIQSWRGMEGGKNAAIAGHDVVMSPTSHCYFDYGLASTDLREVYSFDPIPDGLSIKEVSHIIGGECNMWSEHTPQSVVDGMLFPRLLAMSEVLWTYPPQRNYDLFYERVNTHYDRLKALNVDFGFPTVPVKLVSVFLPDGKIKITPVKTFDGVSVAYQLHKNPDVSFTPSDKYIPFSEAIIIDEPARLIYKASFRGKEYREDLVRSFDPHLGANKPLTLSYEPSPYYPGGGTNGLADGNLGSTNFRDGFWQAVAGQNMEVVVDLGKSQLISSVSSNWFHYANAWIFRPSHVAYSISENGTDWEVLKDIQSAISESASGELIIPFIYSFEKRNARFVKMIANNNGPCPVWHDAPGEPSWLFCDELIVR